MVHDDKNRGLYTKYSVQRLNDESGKHNGCFFFVLDIDHDIHALDALSAYADSCRENYPLLARDLHDIVHSRRRIEDQ